MPDTFEEALKLIRAKPRPTIIHLSAQEAATIVQAGGIVILMPEMYPERFKQGDVEGWDVDGTWSLRFLGKPETTWPRDPRFGIPGPPQQSGALLWAKEPFRSIVRDGRPVLEYKAGGELCPDDPFAANIIHMLGRIEGWRIAEELPERFIRLKFRTKTIEVIRHEGILAWRTTLDEV